MELHSVLVTGANRGIGLEFVRQLVNHPKPPQFVFGTYRSRDGLQDLQRIRDTCKKSQVLLIKMDVNKRNEIQAAQKIVEDIVGEKGLTLLINNAGVCAHQGLSCITEENILYHYKTNTVGPVMIMQEFFPLLQRSAALRKPDSGMGVSRAAILNISAGLGSSAHWNEYVNEDYNAFSYIISKAALNMMGRTIAAIVKKDGILSVLMCPGWVKTDMGSEMAALTVEESVSDMLKTLATLNESHHGEFMDRKGKLYEF